VTISLVDTTKSIKKETPECELEAKVLNTEDDCSIFKYLSGISRSGNPILRRALGRSIASAAPATSRSARFFSFGTQHFGTFVSSLDTTTTNMRDFCVHASHCSIITNFSLQPMDQHSVMAGYQLQHYHGLSFEDLLDGSATLLTQHTLNQVPSMETSALNSVLVSFATSPALEWIRNHNAMMK
jgi:hypothetical protein